MKKILNVLGNILSVIAIVFIIRAIMNLGLDFSTIKNIPQFIICLILGVIFKIITVYITGSNWGKWVWFFAGERGDQKEAIRVYAKANMGKYLPGNVMHYVERNLFADKMGVPQGMVAASSVIDTLSLVAVALLVSFFISSEGLITAIGKVYELVGDYKYLYIIGLALVVIVCGVVAIYLLKKKLSFIINRYSLKDFLKRLLGSLFMQSLALSILGAILVFIYLCMDGSGWIEYSNYFISAYIISWVLGFVVIGSPGGIGIREMVLILLLAPIIGEEMVLTIAVIHRLIMIIGDVLVYLISLYRKGNTKELQVKENE